MSQARIRRPFLRTASPHIQSHCAQAQLWRATLHRLVLALQRMQVRMKQTGVSGRYPRRAPGPQRPAQVVGVSRLQRQQVGLCFFPTLCSIWAHVVAQSRGYCLCCKYDTEPDLLQCLRCRRQMSLQDQVLLLCPSAHDALDDGDTGGDRLCLPKFLGQIYRRLSGEPLAQVGSRKRSAMSRPAEGHAIP